MTGRLDLIERKLGRRIEPLDEGRITNLNHVPESLVKEARSLDNVLLANELLTFYTAPDCHDTLRSFVQQVVFGGVPASQWRRGRTLAPSFSMQAMIVSPRADLLAPLGNPPVLRISPRAADWESGAEWVGAPARSDPDADYRTPRPDHTADLSNPKVEQISDIAVVVRRWIAGRIARFLKARGRLAAGASLVDGFPPPEQWSADARIAREGLLRELGELDRLQDGIPGFRGPDEFYIGG